MTKEDYIAATVLTFYASLLIIGVLMSNQTIEVRTLRWYAPVALLNTKEHCSSGISLTLPECNVKLTDCDIHLK